MLDYNKLFDVAYSDTLPEAVKASIFENVLESIGAKLNESLQTEDSCYVSLLNILINTNITEACFNDVIDTVFASLSEAEIEAITEEFIKSAVDNYIQEGFGTPRPIGLTGLRKELNKGEEKTSQPQATKPSALDKLKSAAGKVKSWVDKVREVNKPSTISGINKLQAEKDARIKKAVEMGTGPKAEPAKASTTEAPKAEVKAEPTKHLPRKERLAELRSKYRTSQEEPKANENPLADPTLKSMQRHEDKSKRDQKKEKKAEKNSISAALDNAFKPRAEVKAEEPKVEKTEAPKAEKKTTKKTTKKAKELKVEEPKVERPTAEKKTPKKTTKKTSTKKADSVAKSVANAATPKSSKKKTTKKKAVKVTRKPRSTNEAIADMLCVLANTNISEAAVEEIVEMISNKKVAQKAIEKEEKGFADAANALNKAVEMSAKTGLPVNPELVKKAEEQGERYEHFKALADKKFGT